MHVEQKMYKAILKFMSGNRRKVDLPGQQDERNVIYVPISIEVDKRIFTLDPDQDSKELFYYSEIDSSNIELISPTIH